MMSKNESRKRRNSIDVVYGAGGIKGFAHIGTKRALEERRVRCGMRTGVSIGSVAATFDTNGFTWQEMLEIFLEEEMRRPTAALASPLSFLNPITYLAGGVVNIESFIRRIVQKYDLKPQSNLRILAYNVLRREPVVFEGTDYDLTKAIAASCAVPFVMRPVIYFPDRSKERRFITEKAAQSMSNSGLLVDGGVHHLHPTHFSKDPSIISVLGFATSLPNEWLSPIDWYFHLLEMFWSPLLNWYFDVSRGEHIVLNVAPKSVAGLTFGVSDKVCVEMVEHGYRVASKGIDRAIAEGRIPVAKAVRESAC